MINEYITTPNQVLCSPRPLRTSENIIVAPKCGANAPNSWGNSFPFDILLHLGAALSNFGSTGSERPKFKEIDNYPLHSSENEKVRHYNSIFGYAKYPNLGSTGANVPIFPLFVAEPSFYYLLRYPHWPTSLKRPIERRRHI